MRTNLNKTLSSDLYTANLLLRNTLQKELKTFNISTEQWTILKELYHQYKNDKGKFFNQKDLSVRCVKDQAALTRTLDILEKKELVKREKSLKDRREFLISITPNGIALAENILPTSKALIESLNLIFTEEEMSTLHNLLNKLIDSFKK